MKKITFITTLMLVAGILSSNDMSAQKFSGLDKSPMDQASFPADYKDANKLVKVTYSRPQLKERSLSKLAPNGKVWRTGANEAAEITLYSDMTVGGKAVKAGTYTLATIPGESEWTVILNSDLNTWGAYFYDESKDVARFTVPVTKASESLEAFSIVFEKANNGATMYLGWDKVRVAVPFSK